LAQDGLLKTASKMGELKSRLFFVLAALVVYRLGAHIPVPGIDPDVLAKLFDPLD
jgi:preprotein translocase subunit SecY